MKLHHAPGYSIRRVAASNPDADPMCEIVIQERATGTFVEGAVFEAALQWHEYILLFLTNDVPFEDTLNIYLLDQRLHVTDYARIYFIYATGIFSDLDITEDDTVRFNFLGEMTWILRLFAEEKFVLPIVSTPLGVHRPFKFSQKFRLSASPMPKQGTYHNNQTAQAQ